MRGALVLAAALLVAVLARGPIRADAQNLGNPIVDGGDPDGATGIVFVQNQYPIPSDGEITSFHWHSDTGVAKTIYLYVFRLAGAVYEVVHVRTAPGGTNGAQTASVSWPVQAGDLFAHGHDDSGIVGFVAGGSAQWTAWPAPVPKSVGDTISLVTTASRRYAIAVEFTPNAAPAISTDPVGASIFIGDELALTCAATGLPAPTLSWFLGAVATGVTGGTLSITDAELTDAGSYTCVASNGVGPDATSNAAVVTVLGTVTIDTDPVGADLAGGASVDLTCAASGTPTPTIVWQKDGADTAVTGGTYSITDARPGDAGSYTCVASNGVGQSATSAAAEVTVTCAAGPAAPTLVGSSIAGSDAVLEFESDPALTSLSWNFVGGAGCDNDGTDTTGGWVHDASGCASTHTLTKPVTALLATCGFSAEPVDGGDTWYYEAVVEATAVNDSGSVFGDDQTRTDLTSFRVRVEFPKDVAVNGTAGVFGAVIDQAALTEQTFDSLTQEFGWNLATSVQYPYYLEPVSTAVAGGHTFDTLPVVASGGDCAGEGTDAAPAACTQDFALSANETDDCLVPAGTTVTVTFQILCRPQYAGSCDLPEGNTTTASFSVETDNFCPQVVEVASITPALTTYAGSAGGTVSTNYILETTLFARVTADIEAGLRAKRTTLTGLDIVSSCTGCLDDTVQPFTDGLSAATTAYGFAYVAGGTDNSATGEVQTDFSFTLNTNSLSFDNDASTGEAQITLTAFVTVEYDTPSAQGLARSYRVQAVSGPGAIGSSATAQASVSSSQPAASSSTAGSTVLGVSAGTAALAAVGLAAVAAVGVGAAVAARRRRAQQQLPDKMVTSSSSSTELAPGSSASAAAVPGMSTNDLGAVQAGYASV